MQLRRHCKIESKMTKPDASRQVEHDQSKKLTRRSDRYMYNCSIQVIQASIHLGLPDEATIRHHVYFNFNLKRLRTATSENCFTPVTVACQWYVNQGKTRTPAKYVSETFASSRASGVHFMLSTTKSAILPTSRLPTRCSAKHAYAEP
jgi:hypothetical protein